MVATGPDSNVRTVISQRKLAAGIFHFSGEPYSCIVAVLGHARTLPAEAIAYARCRQQIQTVHLRSVRTASGRARTYVVDRPLTTDGYFSYEVLHVEEEEKDLVLSHCVESWWQYSQLMISPERWREQWPMSTLRDRLPPRS